MAEKILYTSDMHGNEKQYRALVKYALEVKPSILIIGGELPPKGGYRVTDYYIQMQRRFLRNRLPQLLQPLKDNLPNTSIFVLPGNDDCSVNDEVLDEHPELYINIDRKRIAIPSGLEIVGYSSVPITPFGIKDREKFDLTDVPEELIRDYKKRVTINYNLNGVKSELIGGEFRWRNFSFREQDKVDSIQRDLEGSLFTVNSKKTIYVFHTPMNNTALDIIQNGMHVGSFAIRKFIEKYQPLLTLHGHIHETVDMSNGIYKEQSENSWSMSAGNHNESNELAVLVFDLENPGNAKRIKLPCTRFGKLFGGLKR